MNAESRRKEILNVLAASDKPVSASALSRRFSVSRQIIVGDIALLRAAGAEITALPRGYVIHSGHPGLVRRIPCIHAPEDITEELNIMVDNGCYVQDVIVDHPLYGQLTGPLALQSRLDVDRFVKKARENDALPLSDLTGGIHLHTIICPDEEAYERVLAALKEKGFLYGCQALC